MPNSLANNNPSAKIIKQGKIDSELHVKRENQFHTFERTAHSRHLKTQAANQNST